MSRTSDIGSSLNNALGTGGVEGIKDSLKGKYVCPFCGSVNDSEQGTCPRCTMENSAATRKATKTRIGPWYVLQTRNPAAPGMTWETLVNFVRKGRVKPRSIVRGPTTHQLWRFAAHVKGLSREFGICYSCGATVDAGMSVCPTCNRLQDPPPNPDALLEASREGQMSFSGTSSPATIDGTVLSSGPATVVGTIEPPPPQNEEFVIPALGGLGGTEPAPNLKGFSGPSAGQGGTSSVGPVSTPRIEGLSGDTSWTQITTLPRMPSQPAKPAAPTVPPGRQGRLEPRKNDFNPVADEDLAGGRGAAGRGPEADPNGVLSMKAMAMAFGMANTPGDDEEEFPAQQNPGARARPISRNPRQSAIPTPQPDIDPSEFGMSAADVNPAQAFKRPVMEPHRSSGLFLKVLLILLFLGGAGVGVALAVSADFRQAVLGLYRQLSGGQPEKPTKPKTQPTSRPSLPSSPESPETSTDPAVTPGVSDVVPAPAVPATPSAKPPTADAMIPSDFPKTEGYEWYKQGVRIQNDQPAGALTLFERIQTNYDQKMWPKDLVKRINDCKGLVKGGR